MAFFILFFCQIWQDSHKWISRNKWSMLTTLCASEFYWGKKKKKKKKCLNICSFFFSCLIDKHIIDYDKLQINQFPFFWCMVWQDFMVLQWFYKHFWFGFFVFWHFNLRRLFNAKAILLEEQWWYYLTHSWEDKGVHTFPKDICPKVNVIARLEYGLAYYNSAVYHFNHYTTRTPP